MLHSPSVIAVDDRADELRAIVAALEALDVACLPILVDSLKPNIERPLRGVRVVFFDINYLPAASSPKLVFEAAAQVLLRIISPDNGPYVLVTWSSKSDLHDELMAYLADNVSELPAPALSAFLPKEQFVIIGQQPGDGVAAGDEGVTDSEKLATTIGKDRTSAEETTRPVERASGHDEVDGEEVAVVEGDLSNSQIINREEPSHGESAQGETERNGGRDTSPEEQRARDGNAVNAENSAEGNEGVGVIPSVGRPSLSHAIKQVLDAYPEVAALMQWERAVRLAAGDVVASILELLNRGERFTGKCGPDLAQILAHLANAAVGHQNVASDRRGAISEALTPILFDRLTHLPPLPEEAALWARAVPLNEKPKVDRAHGHKLNTLNLIAFSTGSVHPGDRGAVFQLAKGTDVHFMQRTGFTLGRLASEFLSKPSSKGDVGLEDSDVSGEFRWVLIGTRATCDQAQRRGTIRPVVLALELPDKLPKAIKIKKHGACMLTPYFSDFESSGAPSKRLLINWHWTTSLSDNELADAKVLYRLREPLINQIAAEKSSYQARPGIISFDSK